MRINCTSFCPLLRKGIMETNWFDEARTSLVKSQPLFSCFMDCLPASGFVLKLSWEKGCWFALDEIPWEPFSLHEKAGMWGTGLFPLNPIIKASWLGTRERSRE